MEKWCRPRPSQSNRGSCKPLMEKAGAVDQECRLKLRPIWVLEKGKAPYLKSGIFEAAPGGFERVQMRSNSQEPNVEESDPQVVEVHEIPTPQHQYRNAKGPMPHRPNANVKVTKPKHNMSAGKMKKVETKKTVQKAAMIRTSEGKVVKATYWE